MPKRKKRPVGPVLPHTPLSPLSPLLPAFGDAGAKTVDLVFYLSHPDNQTLGID
jgi:hypothetical protein